jgi:hypothetical protein
MAQLLPEGQFFRFCPDDRQEKSLGDGDTINYLAPIRDYFRGQ